MVVSPAQRTLGRVAAILGMIQGFTWSGLSLTCLIMYHTPHTMDEPSSFREYVNYVIYVSYIAEIPNSGYGFVIRPRDFTILMWFYFLFSSGWFVGSIDQYVACYYNKKRQSTMMTIWGAVTIVISVIDLVFACLLFRDYAHCGEAFDSYPSASPCYLAVGIVMTIAARGYTLWVLNVVFAFVMLWNAWKIIKDDQITGGNYNCSIPRAKVVPSSPFENLDYSKFNNPKNGIVHEMDPASAIPKNRPSSPNRKNHFFY